MLVEIWLAIDGTAVALLRLLDASLLGFDLAELRMQRGFTGMTDDRTIQESSG